MPTFRTSRQLRRSDVPIGSRVCFTGTANKARLESLAQTCLTPVGNVSKKGCDLLVAADVATSSSKARNARKWAIPIMSAEEFIERFERH